MVAALEAMVDDLGARFEPPAQFVVPGPDAAGRPSSTWPARSSAGPSGTRWRPPPPARWCCPTSTACRPCCGSRPAGSRASTCSAATSGRHPGTSIPTRRVPRALRRRAPYPAGRCAPDPHAARRLDAVGVGVFADRLEAGDAPPAARRRVPRRAGVHRQAGPDVRACPAPAGGVVVAARARPGRRRHRRHLPAGRGGAGPGRAAARRTWPLDLLDDGPRAARPARRGPGAGRGGRARRLPVHRR